MSQNLSSIAGVIGALRVKTKSIFQDFDSELNEFFFYFNISDEHLKGQILTLGGLAERQDQESVENPAK